MEAESVKALWDDFVETCFLAVPPKMVARYKGVFYAAFEAALICVVSSPHRFAGDTKAMTEYMHSLLQETQDYFDEMRRERDGTNSGNESTE